MKCIVQRSRDPAIAQMLAVACEKIPMEFSEAAEADRCSRSIVISGLNEVREGGSAFERHRDLMVNVCDFLERAEGGVRSI
ncbi:unnamed protein product [Heligmosomoides polygyrus]|uniref:Transcriptional regulator n=1 Tax=Heligmosomoides polygyrus TaxID=6339 RepID=A0A183FVR1_HELPZ|nr:unnamed protein product [Heligmosomoides polygyrus]